MLTLSNQVKSSNSISNQMADIDPGGGGASSVDSADELSELASLLQSECLIKIFVGDVAQPYLVPQSTLERTSDYFVTAIRNEHLGADNIGILRFLEDQEEVWKLILFWIIKGKLPDGLRDSTEEPQVLQVRMVQCWAAGDRYLMPDFKDTALVYLEYFMTIGKFSAYQLTPWVALQTAFQVSAPGSGLRQMVAILMLGMTDPGKPPTGYDMSPADTDKLQERLEGVPGSWNDMNIARRSFQSDNHHIFDYISPASKTSGLLELSNGLKSSIETKTGWRQVTNGSIRKWQPPPW